MLRLLAPLFTLLLACAPAPPAGADPDFNAWWHDGKAELDGYALTITRYGAPRQGEAVMVFVTEPFSESRRVKVDDPSRRPDDTFDALKLNFVRDFQTGIYDYNTMVSLFTRSDDFSPAKLSMSSAEWCGHVYDEMVFRDAGIEEKYFSYFEGESAERTHENREDGVVEDNLFVLLRGLRGPYLAPGETKRVPFMPSAFHSRVTHGTPGWQSAEIARERGSAKVAVPAGSFDVIAYVVRTPDRTGRFEIEAAYPHRIVTWSWEGRDNADPSRGWLGGTESGKLTGTARLEYWNLHDAGDESYRKQLGLPVSGS